jgi:3-oxoacyl-[acyl-carrier protein] reductase
MSEGSPTALVTNATGFAGPPAVDALLGEGFRVLAHDGGFVDPGRWEKFAQGRTLLEPIVETEPEAVVDAVFDRCADISVIVSNDHYPAPSYEPETAPVDELRQNHEKLVAFPFRLIQASLIHLRERGAANIVFVTSNRTSQPLSGGAFADAARAGVNALVRSLAIDCAKYGITVNAVAPNFLYSEAYYPAAFFIGSEEGRDYVRRNVPVGRLAEPWEIGEVIAFLATAKSRFLTGAVIDFSGGWPFGQSRPNVD